LLKGATRVNAAEAGPKLPAPLRALASRLPRLPASIAFATGLNLTLRRKFPADVLERLEDHTFAIAVDDAGVELLFRVRRGRFVPAARAQEPVLRFRACAWDYVALAAREADPDTLFFNRRLMGEGDTEIALLVKNTLDTIDIPRTRGALRQAMRLLGPREA
jgi:O2-independent ubiquinone biosynthesis accessory factor UbiT